MIVQYNQQPTYMNELDVDNIGEFAVEATNDEGFNWYYVVRTTLGLTAISYCGPIIPDVAMLPKSFSEGRYQIPFNEGKILKDLGFFLNDKGKKITAAEVIEIDDAIEQFVNFKDYLKDFSEEFY